MVKVENSRFTRQENAVLDDVADIVREERTRRFKFRGIMDHADGTMGFHRQNVNQLRRIARLEEFELLRPVYLRLISVAEEVLFDK